MPVGDLAADVAAVFRRAHMNLIRRQVRAFTQARDRGLAASDLADIARAAVAGQVATLLVEADRFEAGRLDRDTGAIEFDGGPPPDLSRTGDRAAVRADDLFGAVAETVLLHGGDVLALARNDMPTETGVAAIYRYV
jgi:imidazolonepropionase-like amidohydrolase